MSQPTVRISYNLWTLSINKPAKHFLKEKFQLCYAEQVVKQDKESGVHESVVFPMNIMKPLGAKWLIEFYDCIVRKPEIVKNGFKAAGTVPLTLNLTHACVCTCACTRLTRAKVNNLACIVSAARKFGVRTNARGTLDMHDTNMPATCTRFAI